MKQSGVKPSESAPRDMSAPAPAKRARLATPGKRAAAAAVARSAKTAAPADPTSGPPSADSGGDGAPTDRTDNISAIADHNDDANEYNDGDDDDDGDPVPVSFETPASRRMDNGVGGGGGGYGRWETAGLMQASGQTNAETGMASRAPVPAIVGTGGGGTWPSTTSRRHNITLYRSDMMQAWRPLAQVVACGSAIRALDDMIEKRRACARAIYGAMRLPRMIALCGVAGSGKRTLVRAYCRARGLNLVELVEHGGMLEAADIEAAYELARVSPPCVLMIHGCDDALMARADAVAAATRAASNSDTGYGGYGGASASTPTLALTLAQRALVARLEGAERDASVWSVLALHRPYTELPQLLADRAYRSFWLAPASYAPPPSDMPEDRYEARAALLRMFMRERTQVQGSIESQQFYVSTNEILVMASINTTPRQLAAFLDRIFEAPLLLLSAAQINTASPATLLPTKDDMMRELRVEGDNVFYITDAIPEDTVTLPFQNLAHLAC